ncbi:hypothetical protein KL949_000347 [Ogataea haglerorum]|nr:hypothetical protein KL913_000421 [Ogataea haglerorum]KAG7723297.1 hypothetical protein KL949_000347 [Ogataea haglerorum]KAG7751230.1 hypothetical protein KL912_000363 [Ogataea haglerorum]KAG7815263.1 hypothetical protein KL924_000349 [Ogataea haglerorum]
MCAPRQVAQFLTTNYPETCQILGNFTVLLGRNFSLLASVEARRMAAQGAHNVVSFLASPSMTSGHRFFARTFRNISSTITCVDYSITSNFANRGALTQQASMRHEGGGNIICPSGAPGRSLGRRAGLIGKKPGAQT